MSLYNLDLRQSQKTQYFLQETMHIWNLIFLKNVLVFNDSMGFKYLKIQKISVLNLNFPFDLSFFPLSLLMIQKLQCIFCSFSQ